MVRFNVLRTVWGAEGVPYAGGEHDVESPPAELLRALAAASDAGLVEILEGEVDETHVQSQEDGEAAYAAAQESGDWHIGNLQQFELDAANPDAPKAQVD